MMYLSYVNDHGDTEDRRILTVVLENELIDTLNKIQDACDQINLKYPISSLELTYPNDKVRLLDNGMLESLKDLKEYSSWERGAEDPLDYYRFQIHNYEPLEDYWHETKPDTVTLWYTGNSFGFNARYNNKPYNGYAFPLNDWERKLQ